MKKTLNILEHPDFLAFVPEEHSSDLGRFSERVRTPKMCGSKIFFYSNQISSVFNLDFLQNGEVIKTPIFENKQVEL